jgi:putative transposase
MKVDFVDSQRKEHGVQPVPRVLEGTPAQIAPSTHYAAKTRPESARAASDRVLAEKIKRVHEANHSVYGARKVWAELNRQGVEVARCTVERLMRQAGLRGPPRDKSPRATRPAPETGRPTDLVDRDFTATRPNELWVADITHVRTAADGNLAASGRRRRPDRACPSQRPRSAISSGSPHPAPGRCRCCRFGRVQRRQLRQRDGRGVQLVVQSRTRPRPRPLVWPGRAGDRDCRVHRLVRQPTPARRARPRSARRVGGATRDDPSGHRNPGNQLIQSPRNPGLDSPIPPGNPDSTEKAPDPTGTNGPLAPTTDAEAVSARGEAGCGVITTPDGLGLSTRIGLHATHRPLLVAGHGTRSPAGVTEFTAFVRRVGNRLAAKDIAVVGGLIELAPPPIAVAGHAKGDIPDGPHASSARAELRERPQLSTPETPQGSAPFHNAEPALPAHASRSSCGEKTACGPPQDTPLRDTTTVDTN